MTSLHEMHEPGIMHNCELRAECDLSMKPGEDGQQPYTYVQNVLVAINPLRRVPHPAKKLFPGKKIMEVQPHPFGIAENSFQRLSSTVVGADNQNQSIVISGESGAGKTETTKICLSYLTQRSGSGLADESAAQAAPEQSVWTTATDEATGKVYYLNTATQATVWEMPAEMKSKRKLDKKILDSNPILENWGNAKTTRNGNSSRFGKFMILQYSNDKRFTLAGATLETYLLEKVRVPPPLRGARVAQHGAIVARCVCCAAPPASTHSRSRCARPAPTPAPCRAHCSRASSTKATASAITTFFTCSGPSSRMRRRRSSSCTTRATTATRTSLACTPCPRAVGTMPKRALLG